MNKNRKNIYFKEEDRERIDYLKTCKEYFNLSDSEIIRRTIKFCSDYYILKHNKEQQEKQRHQKIIEKYGSVETAIEIAKENWLE